MGKLYLLEPGYAEDTVLYELVPVEMAVLPQATLREIVTALNNQDARNIVIDSAYPQVIDELAINGFNPIRGRINR